jgi:uncharacterized protein
MIMPKFFALIASALIVAAASPPAAAAPSARELSVVYPSADISLAALLLVPKGSGPFPAAVIVQGSGDSDRNNDWARDFADLLAEKGFAVLLTDKRGSGASGGDWRTVGFEELAADAMAGVAFLRMRPVIDSKRIGLVGLSQGGRVVPVAAAQTDDVAFVINIVGDAVSFGEQSAHEMANVARQAGLSEVQRQQVLDLNVAAGRALLTNDWTDYSRLRELGLRSAWARIAEGFPPVGAPVWTFFRKSATFDPMSYWLLAPQPVLILYGEADENDNVAVGESVRRLRFGFEQVGKANVQISVLPGLGHSLRSAPGGPLASSARETITSWLDRNVLAGGAKD